MYSDVGFETLDLKLGELKLRELIVHTMVLEFT